MCTLSDSKKYHFSMVVTPEMLAMDGAVEDTYERLKRTVGVRLFDLLWVEATHLPAVVDIEEFVTKEWLYGAMVERTTFALRVTPVVYDRTSIQIGRSYSDDDCFMAYSSGWDKVKAGLRQIFRSK